MGELSTPLSHRLLFAPCQQWQGAGKGARLAGPGRADDWLASSSAMLIAAYYKKLHPVTCSQNALG